MEESSNPYINNNLIHFVGRNEDVNSQYAIFKKILSEGCISFPPHNANQKPATNFNFNGRISENSLFNTDIVCFCDIPDDSLKIHINKYSKFGVGFTKDFLLKQGASPVMYIPLEGLSTMKDVPGINQQFSTLTDEFNYFSQHLLDITQQVSFLILGLGKEKVNDIIKMFLDKIRPLDGGLTERNFFKEETLKGIYDNTNELFKNNFLLFQFIFFRFWCYIKFYDHTKESDDNDNYYYEREWRVIGNIRFTKQDIVRVYIPSDFNEIFKYDYPEFENRLILL
jgi:hypothetical protein